MSVPEFLKRIPDLSELCKRPSRLVPYIAFCITETDVDAVLRSSHIQNGFAEARIKPPANVTDVMRKSNMFVPVKGGGYRLTHQAQQQISDTLVQAPGLNPGGISDVVSHPRRVEAKDSAKSNGRDVFVVYGQDDRLRAELFSLLRAIGLNPLEFDAIVRRTGKANPYTLEVIQKGFEDCQACIVLFSPDESVSLRTGLIHSGEAPKVEFQSRPNVLFEAGMAIALQQDRTVLVMVGETRTFSDLDGRQYVRLTADPASRHKLANRLQTAGCAVSTDGSDWLNHVYDFRPSGFDLNKK